MNLKSSIVYCSPVGRVLAFGGPNSAVTERHEPGPEADAAWERLYADALVKHYDGATWLDAAPGSVIEQGDTPEGGKEEMTKMTESPILFQRKIEMNSQDPLKAPEAGGFSFFLAANTVTPMLELKANGDIMVRGKLIENDKELVDGLREWFRLAKIESGR
jgi:hypothetical protein